jgi:hypothetical protein
MANEAVIIELYGQPTGEPLNYYVPNGLAVEKGSLMKFSGSATAKEVAKSHAADVGVNFAGIAATEKVAGDGTTHIGLWTKGLFDLYFGNIVISPGQYCMISGANTVAEITSAALLSGCAIVGTLQEPVTTAGTYVVKLGR